MKKVALRTNGENTNEGQLNYFSFPFVRLFDGFGPEKNSSIFIPWKYCSHKKIASNNELCFPQILLSTHPFPLTQSTKAADHPKHQIYRLWVYTMVDEAKNSGPPNPLLRGYISHDTGVIRSTFSHISEAEHFFSFIRVSSLWRMLITWYKLPIWLNWIGDDGLFIKREKVPLFKISTSGVWTGGHLWVGGMLGAETRMKHHGFTVDWSSPATQVFCPEGMLQLRIICRIHHILATTLLWLWCFVQNLSVPCVYRFGCWQCWAFSDSSMYITNMFQTKPALVSNSILSFWGGGGNGSKFLS